MYSDVPSSSSSSPRHQGAVRGAASRLPVETRRTPTDASSAIAAHRDREHVDRHVDRRQPRCDLVESLSHGRVHGVRPRVAVGDETRDRVVEVVHAVEVVLGTAREHHRLGEAMGGLRGDRDPLRGDLDVVDAVVAGS